MTAGELLQRGRVTARAWWFPVAVALAVVVFLVMGWNAERRERAAAERSAEAAELARAGVAAAAERTERELRADLAVAASTSAAFEAELMRVRAAAPRARPVVVATGTTGARPASGAPRPAPLPATPAPAGGAAAPPAQPAPGVPAGAGCLLSAGDQGEVRVTAAALQTRAGNLVVAGAAEAWRLTPGPPALLFGGPLQLKVSAGAPERPPGWGAGALAVGGRAGWSVGPAVSPPPLRLWGLQLEALVGAGVGPGGDWAAVGAGLVRW